MAEKKILLLGGGGHCRSVLDCLLSLEQYDQIGIVDYDDTACALGVRVVGVDEDLPRLLQEGWTEAFVTVGSVGSTDLRRRLFSTVLDLGFLLPSIVDPSAILARGVTLSPGVFVGKRAVINTGCSIGTGSIINTGAILEHDCILGDFVHISPGAVLCGQATVGNDSHIGAASVVRQGIRIGSGVLIGAGSVVVEDIPDYAKAYGNPCRVVKS